PAKGKIMPRRQVTLLAIGIMIGLFMASMEVTVVATAMPTVVSQLGGLEIYSWVFSAYILASTTTIPVFGKLSDLYGRRPIYLSVVVLFLLGSFLCGLAQSMPQLILFRAIQGLGAGGLVPLAFIMFGDIYDEEERAQMQGLLAGVWGISAVIGPLLGGFLVDQLSWRWVFYINIIPGLIGAATVWYLWQDDVQERETTNISVDYAGTLLLTVMIVAFLLALFDLGSLTSWGLLAVTLICFGLLVWVERRAVDPIVPIKLFGDRLFVIGCLQGLLAGWAFYGTIAFIPLFVQSVLDTTATAAGASLTPIIFGWVSMSIIGTRWLLPRLNYRTMILAGMIALTLGNFFLTQLHPNISRTALAFQLSFMGIGMGISIPTFLIAVQANVTRNMIGTATSSLQFARSIGGSIGVSVMGLLFSIGLVAGLANAGLDTSTVSLDSLLDPIARETSSLIVEDTLKEILSVAIRNIFFVSFLGAVTALIASGFTPQGRLK
ncbi:MAG: MDR family MFS transporter, partial [Chloroflexota bacterium]